MRAQNVFTTTGTPAKAEFHKNGVYQKRVHERTNNKASTSLQNNKTTDSHGIYANMRVVGNKTSDRGAASYAPRPVSLIIYAQL